MGEKEKDRTIEREKGRWRVGEREKGEKVW